MAVAVVSVALKTFRDLLMEEGRLLSGAGKEVRALETQLKEMKCLFKDADGKQQESESVRNWIAEMRNLAYRAEDIIETYAAEVFSKRGPGLKNLLRRFSCILNEFHSLHQVGSEISQIKSDLEVLKNSMLGYGIKSIIQGEGSSANDNQQWKRQTLPDFQIGDYFVGKDDELKRIVNLLVNDDRQRIVSIWGMGGLGKTTIARKAYNHVDTKRCFQGFAWVCITQQCQIRSVLEDVLKQLNPLMKRDDIPSLSKAELIQEVCQIQKAKPCIIVLDDLWKTDHWDGLKQAFLIQDVKSKILVTTRNQNVAEIGFPIQPRLLSSDSGWELLKRKAFSGSNTPDFACDEKLLMKIGKEMVQKCGFLPLTICLLGGVLSKRKSTKEWELVKENMNAYLYNRGNDIEKENEIHGVLYLSYEDLPHYLKPCFLYLGLFKEDEAIYASDLYRMWIAQGMISYENQEDVSLVVIAELYLGELASRSIIHVQILDEYSECGRKYIECKLHDAVRVLCLRMGKMEGIGLQSLDFQDGKLIHGSLSGVKTRHLVVRFDGENESQPNAGEFAITSDEDTCKHVRSLLLLNGKEEKLEFLHTKIDLQMFKLLRVLQFVRLKFGGGKLPKGIGNLIHLRYLRFDKCELDELPSTIRNFSYLETLDLRTSRNVRVPNIFNKLVRLKHLLLPQYSGDRVIHYALELDEGLDELETLYGFDSSMHRLKSITRLKNLRTFGATVRDNKSLSNVINAITSEWSKLQFCSVYILKGCKLTSTEEGLVILKRVLSCPNLHELSIFVKIGKRLDECRNSVCSSRIVRLLLFDCKIEDDPMTILAKLPVLRELFLLWKSFLGEEITCPALSFPSLTLLSLQKLPNLREWRVEEGAMPLLSEIKIKQCPNLIELPDGMRFFSKLKKLTITGMPSLGKRVLASENESGEGGEDFDKVHHVPSIIINN